MHLFALPKQFDHIHPKIPFDKSTVSLQKFTLTEKFFRQIISLVISLVKRCFTKFFPKMRESKFPKLPQHTVR